MFKYKLHFFSGNGELKLNHSFRTIILTMGYIYRIRNTISGKWYIGCTKVEDVKTRWTQHIQTLNRNEGCPALKDAFKKYGVDKFAFEVMIICFDEDMYEYEKQYIKKYNTQVPNGYNIGAGGIGGSFIGKTHTKETVDKIKKTLRDKYKDWTPEQRKEYGDNVKKHMAAKDLNISNRMKNSLNWQKAVEEKRIGAPGHKNAIQDEKGNVYVPEETKNKISESLKEYFKKNPVIKDGVNTTNIDIAKHRSSMAKVYGIKVGQFDKEGNLIKEYQSTSDAARSVGYKSHTSILNVLDKEKELKGFIWKKLGEPVKRIYNNAINNTAFHKSNCIKIDKFNVKNEFIERYESYISAAKSLSLTNEDGIRKAIKSQKEYHGFIWKLAEIKTSK